MKNTYKQIGTILCMVIGVFFVSCQDSVTNSGLDQETILTAAESKSVSPAEKVFVSDENVTTWDPILPDVADGNWPSTVCQPLGSIAIDDPRWVNPHDAFDVGHHTWEDDFGGIYNYSAGWINSYNNLSSNVSGGPGGHNWSKYQSDIEGNGDFELRLLADNCSWIYLDDKLVGYQDDSDVGTDLRYGVQLDGSHVLTFVIFDGGGAAGGKFRLETTTNPPPPFIPPNTAPVADAGTDLTVEATGPATSITLNGSGSTDEDGDDLNYAWSIDGNEISTAVNPLVELAPGSYTYTLTVSDEFATDSDDVTITIEDTTSPELSFTQVTGNLWPPNHKMVQVVSGIQASDLVDGSTDVIITVTSNESANGRGDGNTAEDYEIQTKPDGSYAVYVRSERSGKGGGRVYTIDLSSSDNAGNTASASIEVSVAKSQGRR